MLRVRFGKFLFGFLMTFLIHFFGVGVGGGGVKDFPSTALPLSKRFSDKAAHLPCIRDLM
jgi:hypothetical protein